MQILKTMVAVGLLFGATSLLSYGQDATTQAPAAAASTDAGAAQITDPSGTFVDEYGTSFQFSLCGDSGTDLCGILTTLKGESATEENLAYVGKQVMQAKQSAPNQWKGSLEAGGISASATVTQTGPDTIEIEGCRAILCQTLAYNRAS